MFRGTYLVGDFFREPAQGRIFEWALLRGLPVVLASFVHLAVCCGHSYLGDVHTSLVNWPGLFCCSKSFPND